MLPADKAAPNKAKDGKKKKPKWTAEQKRARDAAKVAAGGAPDTKAKKASPKKNSGDGPLKRK